MYTINDSPCTDECEGCAHEGPVSSAAGQPAPLDDASWTALLNAAQDGQLAPAGESFITALFAWLDRLSEHSGPRAAPYWEGSVGGLLCILSDRAPTPRARIVLRDAAAELLGGTQPSLTSATRI